MKRTLLILALLFSLCVPALAATHSIQVTDAAITPNTITGVHPGDTITWVWVSGRNTTTNGLIPSAAPGWNSPIEPTVPVFSYPVPNIPGVYNYKSDSTAGMTGSFTVEATGVPTVAAAQFEVYPNPSNGVLVLQLLQQGEATITIADVSGREVVRQQSTVPGNNIDIHQLAPGIYIITAQQGGALYRKELVVK